MVVVVSFRTENALNSGRAKPRTFFWKPQMRSRSALLVTTQPKIRFLLSVSSTWTEWMVTQLSLLSGRKREMRMDGFIIIILLRRRRNGPSQKIWWHLQRYNSCLPKSIWHIAFTDKSFSVLCWTSHGKSIQRKGGESIGITLRRSRAHGKCQMHTRKLCQKKPHRLQLLLHRTYFPRIPKNLVLTLVY